MVSQKIKRSVGSWVVIGVFLLSGTFHLINPAAFLFLLPSWTPEPVLLIYLSGIAEILAAVGLLLRRSWAPIFTAAVLLAIWPANWWFAIDAISTNPELAVIAWLRLPLQLPLIWWAWGSPVSIKSDAK